MRKLNGVIPPITTPFEDGEVTLVRLKENLERWNKTDLSGYLVLGSNGEVVYLNENEKLSIVEACREVIPSSKIMIVGTGMESTQETIRFTNQVAKIGADLAIVITPSYYTASMKPQILHDHFISVAESSKIGILIYNAPKHTGINTEPELVASLSEHPNIIGIKDSSGNIGQLSEIVHMSQKEFAVIVGTALVFFPALCVGGDGVISAVANVAPEELIKIQTLFKEGKFDEARELQNLLIPLGKAVTRKYGVGGLKVSMDFAGYFGGEPRLPLKRPGQEVENELKQILLQIKNVIDT